MLLDTLPTTLPTTLAVDGRRGKLRDRRGEFFGSAAGIGDGASAWDFQQLLFAWRKAFAKGGLATFPDSCRQ